MVGGRRQTRRTEDHGSGAVLEEDSWRQEKRTEDHVSAEQGSRGVTQRAVAAAEEEHCHHVSSAGGRTGRSAPQLFTHLFQSNYFLTHVSS
ncbi:hypothetical protein FKM82_004762 [Ascaphus truei]